MAKGFRLITPEEVERFDLATAPAGKSEIEPGSLECECPRPPDIGSVYCKRYGMNMERRPWEVCSGECTFLPCASEQHRKAMKAKWSGQQPLHRHVAGPPKPAGGPGTEFGKLAASLGLSKLTCPSGCQNLERDMNALHVDGCRAHRDELLVRLRRNAKVVGATALAKAVARAVLQPWVWKLNPLDPLPGMLDEAIRRAEKKGTEP